MCRYEHFQTDWYQHFATLIGFPADVRIDNPQGYRKMWEWAAILQVLEQRGLLAPGRSGLGFAVGQEPLPSFMASRGVRVLATDLDVDSVDPAWVKTSQHAGNLDALYHERLVDRSTFDRLITFASADMNDLASMRGQYDFLWSSCAFEHLGTIEHGLAFVENAMHLLKPGGLAIHTTEYNIVSNDDTVAEGSNCLFRRRDFEALDGRLRKIDCGLEAIDYDAGTHPFDLLYDRPPYNQPGSGRVHIKLELEGYVCTSLLLIAHKA